MHMKNYLIDGINLCFQEIKTFHEFVNAIIFYLLKLVPIMTQNLHY